MQQAYESVKTAVFDSLAAHVQNGSFDIEGMLVTSPAVPTSSADCPAGTKKLAENLFSCGKYALCDSIRSFDGVLKFTSVLLHFKSF